MKKNKYSLYKPLVFFLILLFFSPTLANEELKFLSLKNNEVNLRIGPSFEYPIRLTYIKKYLPVVIIDQSETWRKVRDFESNSGWIHISQLSKKKSAINIKKISILYKKPSIYSKPIAKLISGRLVIIKKCKSKWCKISSGNYTGWVFKNNLWGNI
jgi:SH3-like domain-containing protein